MQAPPPNYAAGPGPKKSKVGLIVGIIVAIVAVCCILPSVLLGVFGYGIFNKAKGFIVCGWTLGQMRDGMVAYAKAHDGKLPGADQWQEAIRPYLKPIPPNRQFQVPPIGSDVCDATVQSGFMYNTDLAGKKLSSIEDPGEAILLWEVKGQAHDQASKYVQVSYSSGPALVGKVPRGWVLQPVSGNAYWMDQGGRSNPIPSPREAH